jgi:cell division cycle 14
LFNDAHHGKLSTQSLKSNLCLSAMQTGLCDMNEFSVEDYEFYEKVENGDWNWLTPHFIAFASPVDANWLKREKEAKENTKAPGTSTSQSRPGSSPSSASSSNLALQRKLAFP